MMSKVNEVPSQFPWPTDPHIPRALHFLGEKLPKEITSAWQKARAAEWAWVKGTSLNLSATVAQAQNHLNEVLRFDADVPGRERAVQSSQRILDNAKALLEAVPEESQRLRVLADRREHKAAFDSAQTGLLRKRAESKPVAIEEVRHVAELRQQVLADEASLREEGKQRLLLREAADKALDDLRSVIVDTLVERLNVISKEGASAIGRDAGIYAEFRELLDRDAPKFKKALLEAKVIRDLARDLHADLDLVAAFAQHFPKRDQVARDLMESVILGDSIKLGRREEPGSDRGILDLET
jgi:hypothetical protein